MKRLTVLALLIGIFLISGVAQAEILDDAIQFINDRVGSAGIVYNVQDQEVEETIGATLVPDLFIDKLDLDLLWDMDKAVIASLNYTIKEGGSLEPYVGAGIGLDRIEKESELGEFLVVVSAGAKF